MQPKFRAWDKLRKRISVVDRIYFDTEGVQLRDDGGLYWRHFREVILMQSTGLFDKNGKEIFEGDIIGSKDGLLNGVVLYRSDLAMWTVDLIRYNNFERLCNVASSREIIGNIHENKDILEVADDQ